MNTETLSTESFRNDLVESMQRHKRTQAELSHMSGVSQGSISKIIRGTMKLSFEHASALWPFVYGHTLTATPTPKAKP